MADSDHERTSEESTPAGFHRFLIILGALLGAWATYVTVQWLLSDWPLVAVFPAMFAVFFAGGAYTRWKNGRGGPSPAVFWFSAVLAVLGVVSLYYASERTDDDVYAENAKAMAAWGSPLVLAALVSLGAIPRRRAKSKAAAILGPRKGNDPQD
jgi:peptidoglycan/LPS O-acetylase OafA/YrhL